MALGAGISHQRKFLKQAFPYQILSVVSKFLRITAVPSRVGWGEEEAGIVFLRAKVVI